MSEDNAIFVGASDADQYLLLKFGNRHGLIAGATGTGKTVTLQTIAEGFSAYGVSTGDDPVAQAMKGLIDNASSHEHQIALLWQALRQLQATPGHEGQADCVPQDAKTVEAFDAEGLSTLVK